MKPWNERSGRIWEGSESIVETDPAKALKTRGTVSAAGTGIKAMTARDRKNAQSVIKACARSRLRRLQDKAGSARPVGPGDGVTPQRRDVVGARGLGYLRQARLFQLPVDPKGGLVGPANHRQPTQDARKCNERRHRSILVSKRPCQHFRRCRPEPQSSFGCANWRTLISLEHDPEKCVADLEKNMLNQWPRAFVLTRFVHAKRFLEA